MCAFSWWNLSFFLYHFQQFIWNKWYIIRIARINFFANSIKNHFVSFICDHRKAIIYRTLQTLNFLDSFSKVIHAVRSNKYFGLLDFNLLWFRWIYLISGCFGINAMFLAYFFTYSNSSLIVQFKCLVIKLECIPNLKLLWDSNYPLLLSECRIIRFRRLIRRNGSTSRITNMPKLFLLDLRNHSFLSLTLLITFSLSHFKSMEIHGPRDWAKVLGWNAAEGWGRYTFDINWLMLQFRTCQPISLFWLRNIQSDTFLNILELQLRRWSCSQQCFLIKIKN